MGPVEEVHTSAAYRGLCSTHQTDQAFDVERNRIEELRVKVDKFFEDRSYQEQVEFGLRVLLRLEKTKQEACRELILLSYGSLWSEAQRSYFEGKALFMMQAKDYFLSFTNRNPNKPNHNL